MNAVVRAQASALLATAVDLGSTLFLNAVAGVYAPVAGALGSVFGGALNFSLNRSWAYGAGVGKWQGQMRRYLLVWCGHVLLSYGLLRLGTVVFAWPLLPVKLAVMALLALGYNHPLHRHYVFKA